MCSCLEILLNIKTNLAQFIYQYFETFDTFLGYFRGRDFFEDMVMHIRM